MWIHHMVDFVDAAAEGEKDRHNLNWMQYISLSFVQFSVADYYPCISGFRFVL
jgi:hypothetical protein